MRIGLMACRNVLYCRNPNTDAKLVLLLALHEFVFLIDDLDNERLGDK